MTEEEARSAQVEAEREKVEIERGKLEVEKGKLEALIADLNIRQAAEASFVRKHPVIVVGLLTALGALIGTVWSGYSNRQLEREKFARQFILDVTCVPDGARATRNLAVAIEYGLVDDTTAEKITKTIGWDSKTGRAAFPENVIYRDCGGQGGPSTPRTSRAEGSSPGGGLPAPLPSPEVGAPTSTPSTTPDVNAGTPGAYSTPTATPEAQPTPTACIGALVTTDVVVDKNTFQRREERLGEGNKIVVPLDFPGVIESAEVRISGEAAGWTHEAGYERPSPSSWRWIGWSNSGAPAVLSFRVTYRQPCK